MPASLTASVRHAAAKDTLQLPFSIPAKEWFSIAEAATTTGMSERFVEELFDRADSQAAGALGGHKHNAGKGHRNTKRIPRVFIVAYLVKTATYSDASLVQELIASIRHLPDDSLRQIVTAAQRVIAQRY